MPLLRCSHREAILSVLARLRGRFVGLGRRAAVLAATAAAAVGLLIVLDAVLLEDHTEP